MIQDPQWCDFHQKWENHNIDNCVEQVKHAQAQAIKAAAYAGTQSCTYDRLLLRLWYKPHDVGVFLQANT